MTDTTHSFTQLAALAACLGLLFSAQPVVATAPDIVFDQDKRSVSARIRDVPLGVIADHFVQQAEVHFLVPQALSTERITAEFHALSLEAALKTLLVNHNYLLDTTVAENQKGMAGPIRVYVLAPSNPAHAHSHGHPRADDTEASHPLTRPSWEPETRFDDGHATPPEPMQSFDYQKLFDESPHVRTDSLLALADELSQDAVPFIINALMDDDAAVRMTSLNLLADIAIAELPDDTLDTLQVLSSEDSDQQVRLLAQQLMTDFDGGKHVQ